MNEITITLRPDNGIKKWEFVKFSSSGQKGIIIRLNKNNKLTTTTTLYPYEEQETKFAQIIWFYLLKLLVFIRLI